VLARDEHLARARLRGRPPEEIHGYQTARDVLTERQIYKCAYCELTFRDEAAPVEHYRPKARADDVDWHALSAKKRPSESDREDDERFARGMPPSRGGFDRVRWVARPGYWWLAWTWENLVFGCTGCNTGVKNARFPQGKAASALRTHEAPPGEERPLLLDPADSTEDPLDHIQYRRVYHRWIPTARDGSARGAWTIALLRLDTSPALLTAYDRRIRRLEAAGRSLDHARTAGDDAVIELEWDRLCEDVLAPNEELLGLTYDWLDERCPASWRENQGLALSKPILRVPELGSPAPVRSAIARVEGLEGLPAPLVDLIRVARNFHVPTGERLQPSIEQKPLPDLVAELLLHRPDATDEELGTFLNRSPATIRKLRRQPFTGLP
jgi:hypothetical protein